MLNHRLFLHITTDHLQLIEGQDNMISYYGALCFTIAETHSLTLSLSLSLALA